MQNKRYPLRVCSRIGFGMFAMMGAWLLCTVSATFVMAVGWPLALSNVWALMLVNDIPLYFIGVPLFLLITAFVPSAPKVKSPRFRFHAGHYALALVFMFGAGYALATVSSLILEGIGQLFPRGGGTSDTLVAMASGDTLFTLVFVGLIPAFGEEFVFRYMIRRKMGECGDLSYVLVSGLCFSLFHASGAQLLFTFVLGALFAWLYAATGKLWVPISLHFLFNITNALLLPLLMEWVGSNNPMADIAMTLLMLLMMAAAITLFFVFRKWVLATMRPPAEHGWPHRPPRWLPLWRHKRWLRRMGLPAGAYPPPVAAYPPPMAACPPPVMAYPSTLPYAAAVRPRYPRGAPYYAPRPRSAAGVCVGNPGMIVYIAVAGVLMLLNTFAGFVV